MKTDVANLRIKTTVNLLLKDWSILNECGRKLYIQLDSTNAGMHLKYIIRVISLPDLFMSVLYFLYIHKNKLFCIKIIYDMCITILVTQVKNKKIQ